MFNPFLVAPPGQPGNTAMLEDQHPQGVLIQGQRHAALVWDSSRFRYINSD